MKTFLYVRMAIGYLIIVLKYLFQIQYFPMYFYDRRKIHETSEMDDVVRKSMVCDPYILLITLCRVPGHSSCLLPLEGNKQLQGIRGTTRVEDYLDLFCSLVLAEKKAVTFTNW